MTGWGILFDQGSSGKPSRIRAALVSLSPACGVHRASTGMALSFNSHNRDRAGPYRGVMVISVVATLSALTCAFKSEEFRYCQDSSFCRRHRKFDGQNSVSTYFLHEAKQAEDGSVSGLSSNVYLVPTARRTRQLGLDCECCGWLAT